MGSTRARRLDEMVDEATVDCYNDSEMVGGLYCRIEEELALPFTTTVLGVDVEMTRVELTTGDRIVVSCAREGAEQRLSLLDVPLPTPPPAGADWVAAYRHWAQRSGAD